MIISEKFWKMNGIGKNVGDEIIFFCKQVYKPDIVRKAVLLVVFKHKSNDLIYIEIELYFYTIIFSSLFFHLDQSGISLDCKSMNF